MQQKGRQCQKGGEGGGSVPLAGSADVQGWGAGKGSSFVEEWNPRGLATGERSRAMGVDVGRVRMRRGGAGAGGRQQRRQRAPMNGGRWGSRSVRLRGDVGNAGRRMGCGVRGGCMNGRGGKERQGWVAWNEHRARPGGSISAAAEPCPALHAQPRRSAVRGAHSAWKRVGSSAGGC